MSVIFKCKMCGGDLVLEPNSNIATCEYCGTTQTVPSLGDEKLARLYNRANQYRMDSEFDKAYSAYESIINDKPDEAEAYWGMLLSEYGVEYVDDPKTGKKVPTCHRTLVRSVTSNSNYKSACQHADPESRMMYEDDAAVLDALQKRVLNASAKEEPYDVFICYKETDENGGRTPDSVMAQDIYDALTNKGMRVFFSRISLEDKLGQDYEPCIFAALNSAKVMLMVTTDSDYCNAVWVKNEWKRYLDFMKNDPSKTLIPVYKDISPYALPDEFAKLQAQDMGKLGAIQDLVRGVEKLAGKNRKAAPAGMTKEEKTMVDAMNRGQVRLRVFLFYFLFAFVFGFASAITVALTNYEINPARMWAAYFTNDGNAVFYDGYNVMYIAAYYALNSIGLALICALGLRGKGTHWTNLVLYCISGVIALIFAIQGWLPGIMLLIIFAVNGILALLTGLMAYQEEKKAKAIHCGIILAVTVVIIASMLI